MTRNEFLGTLGAVAARVASVDASPVQLTQLRPEARRLLEKNR
jgi:hypothetical protein